MHTLRHYRNQLGYTQERMALALGTSLRTYARQESKGGSTTMRKLAELLATSPDCQTDDLKVLSLSG